MVDRGTPVWDPNPFATAGNPQLWLVVASERLPYAHEEQVTELGYPVRNEKSSDGAE